MRDAIGREAPLVLEPVVTLVVGLFTESVVELGSGRAIELVSRPIAEAGTVAAVSGRRVDKAGVDGDVRPIQAPILFPIQVLGLVSRRTSGLVPISDSGLDPVLDAASVRA